MDEFEFKRIVYDYIKEICHYSQMQVFATSSYQKNYFQLQIEDTINGLINFIQDYYIQPTMESRPYVVQQEQQNPGLQFGQNQQPQGRQPRQTQQNQEDIRQILQEDQQQPQNTAAPEQTGQEEFTLEELSVYDGSGGNPAYVAVNGIVYDVSNMLGWAGGTHFGQYAGRDLTDVFMVCHNQTPQILENVPRVGTLIG